HDVCSAIHPLGVASSFMRTLPLHEHGLEWIYPPAALAHPLDDGTAVLLTKSLDATAERLGRDADAYRRLMHIGVDKFDELAHEFLGPLRVPRYPLTMMRFGLVAMRSGGGLARSSFRGERARAVFAGMSAHSMLALEHPPSAAFGLLLGTLAHVVGWPLAKGGSQQIVNALASYLRSLGGEVRTSTVVTTYDELPRARAVLFDVTPRQLLAIMGERLPRWYRNALTRYRYGPGVFKMDFALDGPVPWKADVCQQAATLHLGGALDEIAASERAVWHGQHAERPFVLVAQQSLFDCTRAPEGKHTLWAYCHVPNGSTFDMSARIEAQIERFAPGFRDRVLARSSHNALAMQQYNANYVGGDINGGVQDFGQLFSRPVVQPSPYDTPCKGVYLCSSSTPPGGGVHGLCGYFAAQRALRSLRR
ncbi:MAG: NAD(P)/FAD-dependent oxidoreductase, partial [Chloroflexi bacterium]|nr:NAD(P)/FAD-dependent oxidoreductase [Chloroflexota bacterium]